MVEMEVRAEVCGSSPTGTSPRSWRSAITRTERPRAAPHGQGKKKHGHSGKDLIVAVPEGTVVRDPDGVELADLVSHGDRWLAAEGGRGGKGNARFLSNRMRAPSFAEQGESIAEQWLRLELKLMADVALVGFPNVGKSTFISVVSAAKPKIADYPFTTLVPNLGVVRLDDGFEMVIADIPGLIEGASDGKGLGHRFLRHIERAACAGDHARRGERRGCDARGAGGGSAARTRQLPARTPRTPPGAGDHEGRCCRGGRRIRRGRPRSCCRRSPDRTCLRFWARVGGRWRQSRRTGEVEETYVVHRPTPEGISVVRTDDGGFEVLGREARRAVALSDLTNPDAVAYAQRRLRELGVDKALARAGARDGDSVVIGTLSFDYDSADQMNEGGMRR